ncbi:MAG: hypothetical protein M0C28_39840 [Candidatus Moduliflexus flocculans]|nr:hypothetical protein [Candidatus Moduliflexus flocculans]
MRRLKNLILISLLGISLAAAEKTPIASWSFDQGAAGDEVRGFQKVGRRRGRPSPPFRRADHGRRPPRREDAPYRRGVFGRSLGRPPDLSLDLVRDRQPGEGPQGRLFLRHRSRGPVRAPARRRADGWQECRSDVRLPLYAWNHILGDLRSGHRASSST